MITNLLGAKGLADRQMDLPPYRFRILPLLQSPNHISVFAVTTPYNTGPFLYVGYRV